MKNEKLKMISGSREPKTKGVIQYFILSIDILREYVLIVYLYLLRYGSLEISALPDDEKVGDVIIVPGFNETWHFLSHLARIARSYGYRIHIVDALEYGRSDAESAVERLHAYICSHDITTCTLLAHSRGGITAKLYIDRYGESQSGVRAFVLAAPYGGSPYAQIGYLSIAELARRSSLLTRLQSHTQYNDRITSVYPSQDNHVIYDDGSYLPGAHNYRIDIFGHTRVLYDPQVEEIWRGHLTSR